jgi:hypothetical protein
VIGPFGDQPVGSFVNARGYLLCPPCSKGIHTAHIDNRVCQCGLCADTDPNHPQE